MDALLTAALDAARAADGPGAAPRIVILPVAAARARPDLAAAHGERAFRAAAARSGVAIETSAAPIVDRASAGEPVSVRRLSEAHLVHLPGGDPDLPASVLHGTRAWAAVLEAHGRGACIAGASAGAMALGERLWTPHGPADGLGLVPGVAVLPHFDGRRLAAWRSAVDPGGRLAWVGLDERTLVIGRAGEPWLVAGAGRARIAVAGQPEAMATSGEWLDLG